MVEGRTENFCDGCIAQATKNGSPVVCQFRQDASRLEAAVKKEKESGRPHPISPAARFSTLTQVARNILHCTQISAVNEEIGYKLNPRIANSIGIRISPHHPRDQVSDYLTGKSKKR